MEAIQIIILYFTAMLGVGMIFIFRQMNKTNDLIMPILEQVSKSQGRIKESLRLNIKENNNDRE